MLYFIFLKYEECTFPGAWIYGSWPVQSTEWPHHCQDPVHPRSSHTYFLVVDLTRWVSLRLFRFFKNVGWKCIIHSLPVHWKYPALQAFLPPTECVCVQAGWISSWFLLPHWMGTAYFHSPKDSGWFSVGAYGCSYCQQSHKGFCVDMPSFTFGWASGEGIAGLYTLGCL